VLVLQGNAATKLRCGGKFFILVISYFLLILIVKEFLKSTTFAKVTVKINVAQFFLTHSVFHYFTCDPIPIRVEICRRGFHNKARL